MDQRPSQYTHERQDRTWRQEGRLSQSPQGQSLPASYDPGGSQDRAHLTNQQAAYQPWYSGSGAVHMQTNSESAQQNQWSAYPPPISGEYYNQQRQIPHHPPQYASQSAPHEQAPTLHPSWPNTVPAGDDSQRYLHPRYPLPHSNISDGYAAPLSFSETNPVHSIPQAIRGRRRDRTAVISRSPSQTFGPYTSNMLQSPRDVSPAGTSSAEFISSRTHTPHGEPGQHGALQTPSTIEPPTRMAEPSQFVVPSSRIPRTEVSPHPTVSSQASTPRTSHSPEVSSETKPKRRRANAMQLRALNETHARTMFPTTEERAEIARRVNMTPRQVQIWFQNRRQASRQTQVPDSSASFGPQDPGVSQHGLSGHSGTTTEHHEGSSSYASSGADAGSLYDTEQEDV